MTNARDHIEAEACPKGALHSEWPSDREVQLSQAISLKRIANALHKANDGKGLDPEGLAHAVFNAVDRRLSELGYPRK